MSSYDGIRLAFMRKSLGLTQAFVLEKTGIHVARFEQSKAKYNSHKINKVLKFYKEFK